jgi:hypothetical protein
MTSAELQFDPVPMLSSRAMYRLGALWQGELPLQNAFWNWAVLGGLIVNIASSALFLVLIMADRPTAALIVGYGFSIPYNVVVSVGVWRSAAHYAGEQRWATVAKLVTLTGMILLSVT